MSRVIVALAAGMIAFCAGGLSPSQSSAASLTGVATAMARAEAGLRKDLVEDIRHRRHWRVFGWRRHHWRPYWAYRHYDDGYYYYRPYYRAYRPYYKRRHRPRVIIVF